MIKLLKGDTLEIMDKLIAKGIVVDAIICDPPYGTTQNKWDSVIPFDEMWTRLNKLIKPNGAIVLFGSEPFSSALRMSNIKMYKYDWIWKKPKATGFLNAKKQPLRWTELMSVFYKKQCDYNPQITDKKKENIRPLKSNHPECVSDNYGQFKKGNHRVIPIDKAYPSNIIEFSTVQRGQHPTQKPVLLMEYLIKTYTNENELILDFTMGSGTTLVACKNLNRNGIGIELDEAYFDIAQDRVQEATLGSSLDEKENND